MSPILGWQGLEGKVPTYCTRTPILIPAYHTAVNSTNGVFFKTNDLERVDIVMVKYVSSALCLSNEKWTVWLRTQEVGCFTFLYLTGSSQHAAMSQKSSVVTEKKLKDTHVFYSHSISELHLWWKDPAPPNALKTPTHEALGAGRGWRPGASLSSCPGTCRMHWLHVQKPLPIMQFGFCTPWISQGRLSNQFMFSELFKCMLCLHDRWLWPPLNHPSFPGIFFSL